MQKRILLAAIFTIIGFITFAQQIPVGSCGIVNVYDAAGNRTKRTYFCNNGTNPYPSRPSGQNPTAEATNPSLDSIQEFQEVDALFPNPTTGKFSITFSKSLQNAAVSVTDLQGKKVFYFRASGNKIDFDLSGVAAGVYFVKVEENGSVINKKVIKQ